MNTISAQQINIFISLSASIASLLIARSAWKRRHTPGASWFVGLVVCVAWITFFYALEAAVGFDVNAYVSLSKLEYVGLTYIPLFWLGFSLTYSGRERPLSRPVFTVLAVIPLITIALAWTNDWHGLIWQQAILVDHDGVPIFEPFYGVWFWISTVHTYVIFLIGSAVLARQALGTWRLYRAQAALILVGTALPWISNLLQIFDNLNPFPGVYVNALFLGTAMIALAVGFFRPRLLDIMPLARDTILENISVGFVVIDVQARIIAFNQYVKPYFDDQKRDPIGRLITAVFSALPAQMSDPLFAGQQHWQFHDQVIEINVTPVIDWRGNRRGQLFIFNDVTVRVQAQQALEQSEKRQRALLEAQPDLIFRIRGDGTYLDYHAGNASSSLLPTDKFIGHNIRDLWSPETAARDLGFIQQVLETRKMAAYEFRAEHEGQELHFETRIVASGEDEVVAIVRDIDTRKQAERRALALALERERVTMISQFIQDTSHEFRTPLSVIRVSLHLLKRAETIEKREQRAERIEEQITRLTRLVDVLVKVSTLDGDTHFSFRWSNLNQLVDLIDKTLPFSDTKNITVVYELQPNLPPVQVDHGHFIQALQELMDNAFNHSPPKGTITVRTYSDADGVTVEVQDEGSGIPAEAIPRLFERFYRLDNAHTTPGFGLGLSIAKRIIELHGGMIDIQSTVGVGSRFMIRLPYQHKPTLDELLT